MDQLLHSPLRHNSDYNKIFVANLMVALRGALWFWDIEVEVPRD